MRFERMQRFILAKKIFWGLGHFNFRIDDLCILHYLAAFLTVVNILKLINVGYPTSLAFKLFWVTSYCISFVFDFCYNFFVKFILYSTNTISLSPSLSSVNHITSTIRGCSSIQKRPFSDNLLFNLETYRV